MDHLKLPFNLVNSRSHTPAIDGWVCPDFIVWLIGVFTGGVSSKYVELDGHQSFPMLMVLQFEAIMGVTSPTASALSTRSHALLRCGIRAKT